MMRTSLSAGLTGWLFSSLRSGDSLVHGYEWFKPCLLGLRNSSSIYNISVVNMMLSKCLFHHKYPTSALPLGNIGLQSTTAFADIVLHNQLHTSEDIFTQHYITNVAVEELDVHCW